MTTTYDVAVVGLGPMGSAAAYNLAKRGRRVIGFDRYAPPHRLGSSSGLTRIIREAYFEHPLYVPLIRRAYEAWEELARAAGVALLQPTGGLMLGPPSGVLVSGAIASATEHDVPFRVLDAGEVRRAYPAFAPLDGMVGVEETRAGVLRVEPCISAFLDQASRLGATLHADEPVLSWEPAGDGATVATGRGTYHARHLVIAAGAWTRELLRDLDLPLRVARQVLHWFEPTSDAALYRHDRCPISLWELESGQIIYTTPDFGDGFKIGVHHEGEDVADPARVRRAVSADEDAYALGLMRRFMPRASATLRDSAVCLYTNTPDLHFLIDAHPRHPQVTIASPCSGHGFKFASVIGEIVADLLVDGRSRFDLSLFRRRFA